MAPNEFIHKLVRSAKFDRKTRRYTVWAWAPAGPGLCGMEESTELTDYLVCKLGWCVSADLVWRQLEAQGATLLRARECEVGSFVHPRGGWCRS